MATLARDLLGWFLLDGFLECCRIYPKHRAVSSVIFLVKEINGLRGLPAE